MFAYIASAAIAFATTVSPAAPAAAETVQPVVPAPVRAAAAPRRRHHRTDTAAMGQTAASDDAMQSQIERHVQMPALTGDGGG